MRVMLAMDNRFYQTKGGKIYSSATFDYSYWQRYLQVFDEVTVFARVGTVDERELNRNRSDGPNVQFKFLPMYIGPKQYIFTKNKIQKLANEAIDEADAFILRIPSQVGTHLWRSLMARGIPYGVEVVGSSYDSMKTCGVKTPLKQFLMWYSPRKQKLQCKYSTAASYITKNYLQSLYPPGNWSTFFSNVELYDESIINEKELTSRHQSLDEAFTGKRPFRICHVGNMGALYKAQDVLMQAISECCKEGFDIDLFLCGDGKYKDFYKREAVKLGIQKKVHFLGYIEPGKTLYEHLDKSDLFVLPSLTEGQGRALIEAMARGLPAIGSSVGGITELLEPEYLVPPNNTKALENVIKLTLKDKTRMIKMSIRNLNEVQQYKRENLNKRRVEFYSKVKAFSEEYKKGIN